MNNNTTYHPLVVSVLVLALIPQFLFLSCTGLRNIPDDQYLYRGSELHIEKIEPFKDDRKVKEELSRVLRPQPNSRLLLSRPRLWMHQVAGEPTGRGIRHLMRERLGEEAVLFDPAYVERNIRLINNRLYNMGYFDAWTGHAVDSAKRTVGISYHIQLQAPYRFGSLNLADREDPLADAISTIMENSLIIPGEPYSLQVLRRERERIGKELKIQGYYYFHPDHILFRADSASGDRKVDIYTTIKQDIPAEATRKYKIGRIYVHADYMTGSAQYMGKRDTLQPARGVYYTDAANQFEVRTILRAISFRPDSLYDIRDHERTLNHLMSLGVFRFVNLRFSPRTVNEKNLLDIRILLTPHERRSIVAELSGVTKSNHFTGPGFSTVLINHNLLQGAESFQVSLSGAYETLFGRQRTASSAEFGLDASLSIPRFVLPAEWKESPKVLAPKTNISLGINYLSRTDAFRLTTLQAQYGYSWNRDMATQWRISPLVFSLFVLGDVDEDLEGVFVGGNLLRKGLFEQFIIGGHYRYTYNSRLKRQGDHDWFLQLNLDLSGNLAYLLMDNMPGGSPGADGRHTLFNQGFAQYARTDIDLRYYRQLGTGRRLATRIFMGTGIPYGNSDMLPYVKQYVIGGSNSIRAFHPRSLGPGSYSRTEEERGEYNIFRTGEMKLEANIEYRFDITNLLKGALFVDAGNIWRLREDEEVPGGMFATDRFFREIALGAGTGLRVDAGFFILRFDFAVPIADPATGDNGYFGPVRLFDRQWRRDNLIFNLGIGYPF